MIRVNGKEIIYNRFPDGTLNIKGDSSLQNDDIIITWKYKNNEEFMALAFLTRFYQEHGNSVSLFMPYIPNARMDRTENKNDIFTMKYFGEMINSLNFKKVFVLDPHSAVSVAVINNCQIVSSYNSSVNPKSLRDFAIRRIVEIEKEEPILFFPDEGAMKRYSKNLNIPYAFGTKKRDWQTGNILGLEIMGLSSDQIKGKNILIQDDICSKGGTFYHSAKKLKEMGSNNIYLLVTHCENSIWRGQFGEDKEHLLGTGLIKHVFTTDSIYDLGTCDLITVYKA